MKYYSLICAVILCSCTAAPNINNFTGGSRSGNLSSTGSLDLTIEIPSDRFQEFESDEFSYSLQYNGRTESGAISLKMVRLRLTSSPFPIKEICGLNF